MNVAQLRRFFDSLPARLDALPVVIAPPGYAMPAELSRVRYLPADRETIISIGPCLVLCADLAPKPLEPDDGAARTGRAQSP